jgi:phosphoribosyl 1,2-cyclic phosphodiesterase
VVEVEGEPPLIVDLGTGLRSLGEYLQPQLQDRGRPLQATALLSHLHYDHMLGLPFFTPMQDPGAVLDVFGPSQTEGPLEDVIGEIVKPPFFPVHMAEFRGQLRFHELEGTEELAIGVTKVKVRSIPHVGHTLGFRIESDGRTVAYLSDHQAPVDRCSVDVNVLELCAGADLVIHDAQYTDEEFAALYDWGHSTAAYAAHVANEAGARRLVLFHHDPSHTDDDIDGILANVRRTAAADNRLEISAAFEGSSIDLGNASL